MCYMSLASHHTDIGFRFDPELRDPNSDGLATRWGSKKEIIVMENIAIVPPYHSNNVHAYSAKEQRVLDNIPPGQRLDFVKKMVRISKC